MILVIEDARGRREVGAAAFPLVIGGPGAGLWLGESHPAAAAAVLGLEGEAVFIQPVESAESSTVVNGQPLTESRWLAEGDVIAIGDTTIEVRPAPEGRSLVLACGHAEPETAPPLDVGSAAAPVGEAVPPAPASRLPIEPVVYEPGTATGHGRSRRSVGVWVVTGSILLLLMGLAALVLSARAVSIDIVPEPEWVTLDGAWPTLEVGGRWLVVPGRYRLEAGRAGYEPLSVEVEVGREGDGVLRAALVPLPGRLTVHSGDVVGADVLVDGVHLGATPLEGAAVDLGQHSLEVLAARHQSFETTIEVVEPAQEIVVEADLVEAWAALTVRSRPSGATVVLDGREEGATPVTVEAGAGQRVLGVRLPGYSEHRQRVTIEPGRAVAIDVSLQRPPGSLRVRTDPAGASVRVDGVFKGVAPVDVGVTPGEEHEVRATLAGHRPGATAITVAAGQRSEVLLELAPETGVVELVGLPGGAEVLVDGRPVVVAEGTIELLAVPHTIEVRQVGAEPFRAEVTPRAGVRTRLRVEVKAPATPAPPAEVMATSQGADLRLIRPGRFTMGAPRREPGRRADEILRDVEISRPFYLGVREVTNREFRDYNPDHRSGGVEGRNLEIDHHPVVRVRWEEAARYCNWLSAQEGLDPVYEERAGRPIPRTPLPNGYRLPTEAEWAWAARHPGGSAGRKYAWGDELPIPRGAGNFADSAAHDVVDEIIEGYSDGHAVTAPAGSYEANPVGIFNLGGNVAEWVHDIYEVRVPVAGAVERDPVSKAEGEYHVIRGASWMSDRVTELRLSAREAGKERRPDLGFRIARSVD